MAVQEENPYHYTGLHAFGFLEGADGSADEVMGALREMGAPPDGPVIWSGSFVGDYQGLVHVRVDEGALGELQDLISGPFFARGFRGRWAIEARPAKRRGQNSGTSALFVGVKRGTQEIIAISALRVMPERLDGVLDEAQGFATFRGASLVFGKADVLVQLGADDWSTIATSVEVDVQGLDGVVSASTAFCDGSR
jgi:hypothetical protein